MEPSAELDIVLSERKLLTDAPANVWETTPKPSIADAAFVSEIVCESPRISPTNKIVRSPRFGGSNMSTPRGESISPRPKSLAQYGSPLRPLSPEQRRYVSVVGEEEEDVEMQYTDVCDPEEEMHGSEHVTGNKMSDNDASTQNPAANSTSSTNEPSPASRDTAVPYIVSTDSVSPAAISTPMTPPREAYHSCIGDTIDAEDLVRSKARFKSAALAITVPPANAFSPLTPVQGESHPKARVSAPVSAPASAAEVEASGTPSAGTVSPSPSVERRHTSPKVASKEGGKAKEGPGKGKGGSPKGAAKGAGKGKGAAKGSKSSPSNDSGSNVSHKSPSTPPARASTNGNGNSALLRASQEAQMNKEAAALQKESALQKEKDSLPSAESYVDQYGDVFYDCPDDVEAHLGTDEEAGWAGWTCVASDGRLFYYHQESGKTQWECPEALYPLIGEWKPVHTGADSTFWHNSRAQLSLWSDPNVVSDAFEAALIGNAWFLQLFHQAGGSLRYQHPVNKATILHYAVAGGSASCVQFIINSLPAGGINDVDANGESALSYGVRYGYWNLCKLLVDARCSPELARKALELAQEVGASHCEKILEPCLARRVSFADEEQFQEFGDENTNNDNINNQRSATSTEKTLEQKIAPRLAQGFRNVLSYFNYSNFEDVTA